MQSISRPRDLGVPHDEWRPNQLQALKETLDVHRNGGGFVFAELGTGSGKSGVASALASEERVLVLVQNLGLLEQYERIYGFSIVKGRQEYPCASVAKIKEWKARYNRIPTAEDCHLYSQYECVDYYRCSYCIAREKAANAQRAACTYKYAMLSDMMQARNGIVVLDEAHLSADEILSISSFEITDLLRREFDLPPFPYTSYGVCDEGDLIDKDTRDILEAWFLASMNCVASIDLFDQLTPIGTKMRRVFTMLSKGLETLRGNDFIFLSVFERRIKSTNTSTHVMSLRPMDARDCAQRLWKSKPTTLLMSATIGNPDPLANELGIEAYTSLSYDHPIPVTARPVFDLNIDKMTKSNLSRNPNLYQIQAISIYNWINKLPKEWRGIVLTTSYDKIKRLRSVLSEKLPDRIFTSTHTSLNERVSDFIHDIRPGMVAVETIQGWGSGIDLYGDIARFAVVAGVPFANPSDRYEQERMNRPGGLRYSRWTAYNAVPQAVGRVSRGETNPDGTFMLNVAAIADGSASTPAAYSFMPRWFKEAIT